MKKVIIKSIAAALTLVLALGCVIPAISQGQSVTARAEPGQTLTKLSAPRLSRGNRNSTDSWKSNVLTTDPLGTICSKKEAIGTVTFLDSLDGVPRNAWNMGKGSSSRVKGWVEWDQGVGHVFFAAKGGINGELAAEGLFQDCVNLYEISFNGALHLETAKDLDNMFFNCERLQYVDTWNLDTSSATTMYQMFRNCYALEELDVSSFDTSNVKNMSCMFSTCYSLTELDLCDFDTSRVTNMSYMFSACRGMEYVEVRSFNTSKVTNMEGMFRWCSVLEELNFSGWDVSRVNNHYGFMNEGMTINGQPWEYFFS